MMILALFNFLLFSLTNADPLPQTCISVMGDLINISSFAESVAHGVHSMTVEDAKFYFDPNIGDKIKIPTINQNLTGDVLLEYLPFANYDHAFTTMALKNLDLVMRNIGKDDWSIQGLNTLEKLAHVFHMQALWEKAGQTYKMFVTNPPEDPQFCSCINMIGQNDLLEALFGMAERIRGEELDINDLKEGHNQSLEHRIKRSPSPRKEDYRRFKYKKFSINKAEHRIKRSPSPRKEDYRRFKYKKFSINKAEHRIKRSPSPRKEDYRGFKYKKFKIARQKRSPEAKRMSTDLTLENNEIQRVPSDEDMPELIDSKSWKKWKAMLQEAMMKDDEYKNLAAYMFCSLKSNEPDV